MKFVDEIDCLIKKYNESRCFIATNEYGKELQKIYKQIVFDLDSLKSDYCLINRRDTINKLEKKLKKARKEKKRWKRKYLELYNYVKMMEGTTYVTIKDPMLERIEAGLGIPPIKSLNEDFLKPVNSKGV